ncbi:MAG: aminomethyl-transferring glycine dehydrogenase [Pseudomonadota bacterium]
MSDDFWGSEDFLGRHIGPNDQECDEMLESLGVASLDALIEKIVPGNIRDAHDVAAANIGPSHTEIQALEKLREMAIKNKVMTSMIGRGYYNTVMPQVIQRNVLESPSWYTSYTPYQAEISQGRLTALMNYQQMIIDMTGLPVANASLLDEATAAAEAMAMLRRISKSKAMKFFVGEDCLAQTLAVLKTRAEPLGIEIIVGCPDDMPDDVFGAFVSCPGASGVVMDYSAWIADAHAKGILVAVSTDLLALAVMKPPGEMGCDVAIGSAQRFGVPMGFGGPHAAFFATRQEYMRQIPGRIIGVSQDRSGRMALRMALQTREQHIRREKANSNICTAQALLAIIASFYAIYHGPEGIARIARRVAIYTRTLAKSLQELGISVRHDQFFDTLTLDTKGKARALSAAALERGINIYCHDNDILGISLDEVTNEAHLRDLLDAFQSVVGGTYDFACSEDYGLDKAMRRTSPYLQLDVFNAFRSETELMRYMRLLANKDLALDRAMIPLGSCTMKLNAATEMAPVSWQEFANIHPFAPSDQVEGYHEMIGGLSEWLCQITGYDALSMQPNSGAQGEFAGLMTIRAYYRAKGEEQRNICLIPTSAHGTNPASASMADFKVVAVKCGENGDVDIDDLRTKAEEHADHLAALMITYPSTHGVFEAGIREICQIIHDNGGQVYLDGANLNAMMGNCRPGNFGADVSHLNLHKTFCIPHGGGGPGMGPIGVKAHLAPFLPEHSMVSGVNPHIGDAQAMGEVSAAPWGSALILPISWAYIYMMGTKGLRASAQIAILSANYMANRLQPHFPVLYRGENGFVAHECIIDLRHFKKTPGISVDDVAKRLMDFGFHSPTMSWPVADTLMIEPTESECKAELDRFCDAMIIIREEIAAIEKGEVDGENNVLKNAPHRLDSGEMDEWPHPYSRTKAFFPGGQKGVLLKYFPPVGRIDNVGGDRNVICSCPPMSAYE